LLVSPDGNGNPLKIFHFENLNERKFLKIEMNGRKMVNKVSKTFASKQNKRFGLYYEIVIFTA
jgi:hypothetical protein